MERLGYTSIIEPLLAIVPTHATPPDLKGFDAVILTSASCLSVLVAAKADMASLFYLPCFCVGTATADAARDFGFQNVLDAEGDGAALADLMRSQKGAPQPSVLHICGTDVNPDAQRELEDAGYDLTLWPVYSAAMSKALSSSTAASLEQGKIDAVLLFSTRTADALAALLAHYTLEACCQGMIAIGISEVSLTALRPLSWRKLAAAPAPNEGAMIKSLQTLLPVTGI